MKWFTLPPLSARGHSPHANGGAERFYTWEVFFGLTGNISNFIFNIDVDIQISDDGIYPRVAGSVAPT